MSRIVHRRNHIECSIYAEVDIYIYICYVYILHIALTLTFSSYPSLSLTEQVECGLCWSVLLVICKADTFQLCWSAKFSRFPSGRAKDPRSEVLAPPLCNMQLVGKRHSCKHLYTGSTISTLLYDKINPKDCQVLSLGDSGFLPVFRFVSSDYGKPRYIWFLSKEV